VVGALRQQTAPRQQTERGRHAGQRPPAGLVDSVLAVAIVANLVSYVLSIEPGTVLGTGYDAREIAAVLPLGAVLAGRALGPKLALSMRLTQVWFHEISGNVVARQRPTFPDAPVPSREWIATKRSQKSFWMRLLGLELG
jgi:hypothetical protein